MAKQRGIHQIKGKINNLCYYEQKYVRGGLIRRINEAMSERLKTDPAFERTRRANVIFGACSSYARFILSYFGSRNTFLFIPYRQAILTRLIHTYFLQDESGNSYPAIYIPRGSEPALELLFDEVVKNKLSLDFFDIPRRIEISIDSPDVTITLSSTTLENYLSKYGGVGVRVEISVPHYLYNMSYNMETGKYPGPSGNPGGRGDSYIWRPGEGDLELSLRNPEADDSYSFWVVYISPLSSEVGGRFISKRTGATCGMIQTIYV